MTWQDEAASFRSAPWSRRIVGGRGRRKKMTKIKEEEQDVSQDRKF